MVSNLLEQHQGGQCAEKRVAHVLTAVCGHTSNALHSQSGKTWRLENRTRRLWKKIISPKSTTTSNEPCLSSCFLGFEQRIQITCCTTSHPSGCFFLNSGSACLPKRLVSASAFLHSSRSTLPTLRLLEGLCDPPELQPSQDAHEAQEANGPKSSRPGDQIRLPILGVHRSVSGCERRNREGTWDRAASSTRSKKMKSQPMMTRRKSKTPQVTRYCHAAFRMSRIKVPRR